MLRKILIITCLLSMVFVGFAQKKKKKDAGAVVPETTIKDTINYRELGSPLPEDFMVVMKDGKVRTKKHFDNKANFFVMMFNPTCEHCQEETELFKKNIFLFKKTEILLVAAPVMRDYMEFFENVVRIQEYPSIQVSIDSCKFIDRAFIYQNLPQLNIYDKDRKLLKIFTGDTPLDSLKQYIE